MNGNKGTVRLGAVLLLFLTLSTALEARGGLMSEPASPAACKRCIIRSRTISGLPITFSKRTVTARSSGWGDGASTSAATSS
jgi:hypothetical protein